MDGEKVPALYNGRPKLPLNNQTTNQPTKPYQCLTNTYTTWIYFQMLFALARGKSLSFMGTHRTLVRNTNKPEIFILVYVTFTPHKHTTHLCQLWDQTNCWIKGKVCNRIYNYLLWSSISVARRSLPQQQQVTDSLIGDLIDQSTDRWTLTSLLLSLDLDWLPLILCRPWMILHI